MGGRWSGGQVKKSKINTILNSVEVKVEVGVELGKIKKFQKSHKCIPKNFLEAQKS